MKKILLISLFMLATLAWATAQDAGRMGQSGGQATTPGAQAPGAGQAQPGMPHGSDPGVQPGPAGQGSNSPVTEGCLGGTAPNFTITDKAGTTYKLNIPPTADVSALTPHVGESVQVQGDLTGKSSIDVQRIGAGTGTCPGAGATSAQPPAKR